MPVVEYHCVPKGRPRFPAIMLLHGLSRRGAGYATFEQMCTELAGRGYYTEFVEYYSQTEAVVTGHQPSIKRNFPIWLGEVDAGLDDLRANPSVDSQRVGMVGFSMGAFLSLTAGATQPGRVAAIVDYYGSLPNSYEPKASNLPPTLIIHGARDSIVPVSEAHDLDTLMTRARRPHQTRIYADANHAFNFPRIGSWYKPADARDAWNLSLRFLDAHLLRHMASR
jgi:dienelactone hydrolase